MEPGIITTNDARMAESLAPVQRRYRLLHEPTMPMPGAVLPRGILQECDLLAQAKEVARREREELLSQAQAQADAHACLVEQQTQAATLKQAAQLLGQLEQAREEFFQQAEDLLLRIARDGLEKLLVSVPALWQDRSSVRLLLREFRDTCAQMSETPAQLHVRPEALQDIRLHEPPGESWPALELVADEALAPGQCLLRCAQGELRADYLASVEALITALHNSPIQPTENALRSDAP